MLAYDFIAPARIAFGWGRRSEIGVLSTCATLANRT